MLSRHSRATSNDQSNLIKRLENMSPRVKPKFMPDIRLILLLISLGCIGIWKFFFSPSQPKESIVQDDIITNNDDVIRDLKYVERSKASILKDLRK